MRQYSRLFLIVIFLSFFAAPLAKAQTPTRTLWLTWRATTYLPSGYSGRAMPIPDTKIIGALDLIENGRITDISKETIYWYVNDALLTGGQGLTRVSVPVPNSLGGSSFDLRVSLPDYEGGVAKTITVPVLDPEVIIPPPAPGNIISSSSFLVRGIPYFFDVSDPDELNVNWQVNGQAPRSISDPLSLKIDLGSAISSGTPINIEARAENPSKVLEFATAAIRLIFQP